MARTNIDIDEQLCQRVMKRYNLSTKREAVNLALRHVAGEPLGIDQARSMRTWRYVTSCRWRSLPALAASTT